MDLLNTKSSIPESHFIPYDSRESCMSDSSNCWYRSDDSPGADNSFSFSVVCRSLAAEFPFPSINYPSNHEDLLDPQFSVDCVYGGGSMLSSLDVSLESCLGMSLTFLIA